ncbi:MAG: metallophosphoesterase family protein [Lachnospiraceae bacterium]|nr:metallophosphoesterase family protein [Lachnospiraceae bacterium]
MKIAVLSDIHGNYVALKACLDVALAQGIDTFVFLGDYVAEFPYPQRTLEILYEMRDKYTCYFIRGNKEDYWITRKYDKDCIWRDGNHTVGAMHYTYEHQTEKDLNFYQGLKICETIQVPGATDLVICHGSPDSNTQKLQKDNEATRKYLEESPYPYIIYGHIHRQGIIECGRTKAINPGAVGVPAGSDGKTQFMILHQEDKEWREVFYSLDYDRERVLAEIKESGLEQMAPFWTRVTKKLIMDGSVTHGRVLTKAMELCEAATGSSLWYDIPDVFWEEALRFYGI